MCCFLLACPLGARREAKSKNSLEVFDDDRYRVREAAITIHIAQLITNALLLQTGRLCTIVPLEFLDRPTRRLQQAKPSARPVFLPCRQLSLSTTPIVYHHLRRRNKGREERQPMLHILVMYRKDTKT